MRVHTLYLDRFKEKRKKVSISREIRNTQTVFKVFTTFTIQDNQKYANHTHTHAHRHACTRERAHTNSNNIKIIKK
jgi:ABC-type nickel/cobalt efflux system permease component RcnA